MIQLLNTSKELVKEFTSRARCAAWLGYRSVKTDLRKNKQYPQTKHRITKIVYIVKLL